MSYLLRIIVILLVIGWHIVGGIRERKIEERHTEREREKERERRDEI